MRRLSVVLGGSAEAAAWTLAAFMAGLGLGGWLARAGPAEPTAAARTYSVLELVAAFVALGFPTVLAVTPRELAALLPIPAAMALGATWPVLARALPASGAVTLYAANTAGAVFGTVLTTFVTLPTFGVRGAELVAAGLGVGAAGMAWRTEAWGRSDPEPHLRPPVPLLAAAGIAGAVALGLEVVWMRLAAAALGATVQTFGTVLIVFLATIAVGSALGRRWPADPLRGAGAGLAALGTCALLGAVTWPLLPFGVAWIWRWLGADGSWLGHLALAGVWMAGAPAASGLVFALLVRAASTSTAGSAASWLYAVNTLGSTIGALAVGLWLLPALGPRVVVGLLALCACAGAIALSRRFEVTALVLLTAFLAVAAPAWDARLYAVGVHLRISDFVDPSAQAVRRYADEGWDLLHYEHGATAAVAVGRSKRTGNVWLSINGKFDASTGEDMPTQVLSAEIPLATSRSPRRVGIVGLASGVTAGTALADPRVHELVVFELEPAVVRASHYFDHVNGRPLEDGRTTLRVDDARAVLTRDPSVYDVLISEPSNPWITGVSSLFTEEYWRIARSRLAPGGVFCQWVQLYGMGPDEFRGIVRTFQAVFGDVWLYETIQGSDVLLVAGPPPGDRAPIPATLDPDGVRRLAGEGWSNTDDHPRVEWEAPRWIHRATAEINAAAIQDAATSGTP